MTRRERLMATLRGEPVDRPAVSFYEINGLEDTSDADPFNVYSDPSWQPLIQLAQDRSDRIVTRGAGLKDDPPNAFAGLEQWATSYDMNGSRYDTLTLRLGRRVLTQCTQRDRDMNTVWTIEHLIKDVADLKAWLEVADFPAGTEVDSRSVLEAEAQLGDAGIVMLDTADPLCWAASLFEMGTFTVMAMTEPDLFRQMLEKCAAYLLPKTELVARTLPGRLWRICGPEYASEPYLPPRLFHDYVVPYVRPMVASIQRHGGFARVHCHGRLRNILDSIVATGCMALDPIEPPPQGDVDLAYVRAKYGRQLVLFGNLEASDLENLPTPRFEEKIRQAVREGTAGAGRGFVLMPSACPCGRVLASLSLRNYAKMIDVVGA